MTASGHQQGEEEYRAGTGQSSDESTHILGFFRGGINQNTIIIELACVIRLMEQPLAAQSSPSQPLLKRFLSWHEGSMRPGKGEINSEMAVFAWKLETQAPKPKSLDKYSPATTIPALISPARNVIGSVGYTSFTQRMSSMRGTKDQATSVHVDCSSVSLGRF